MTDFIFPDWVGAPSNLGAFSTTRKSGTSLAPYDDGSGGGGSNLGMHVGDDAEHVRQNRALLRAFLPSEPAWLTQVHGAKVIDAATVLDGETPEADASISDQPGTICAIQTADCLPVLFCEAGGRVVGAAHAGWRGLAGGVLENTVTLMRERGAGEILAWLGPAIGANSFEVGAEVRRIFLERDAGLKSAFKPVAGQAEKYLADIYSLAKYVLAKAGVNRLYGGGFCTVTEKQRFYSYRRDKTTGRMASLIWLK